jgi:glycosyltransferase involved in cell wall biosynthesis
MSFLPHTTSPSHTTSSSATAQAQSQPDLSLVIPTLNEEDYLPKLLTDLTRQTFANFEVIVVDAHSNDQTLSVARDFAKQLSLNLLNSKQRNVSHQRNLGGAQAKSDWILFMDADNRLPHYFLQGIKYQLEKNPDTDFFTSGLAVERYPLQQKPVASLLDTFLQLGSRLHAFTYGGFMGIKRSVFQDHQFNTNTGYQEDYEFSRSLAKQGYNFNCFTEPKWKFSLRRFEKDGLIKILNAFVSCQVQAALKKQFPQSFDLYPMQKGGGYYQDLAQVAAADQEAQVADSDIAAESRLQPMQIEFLQKLKIDPVFLQNTKQKLKDLLQAYEQGE